MCHRHWAHRRPSEVFVHSQCSRHDEPGQWAFGGDVMSAREEGFGVRRPLRFLAYRLGLDDQQVATLARILDELKTERAQAAVDDRRKLSDFAEAISGESFDAAKAASAGDRRTDSARHLRDAVVKALAQIHAMLNPEQRTKLAYLIRTGVLQV